MPADKKWESYLDGLKRMNWDTFQFGSYRLKDWHYDEVICFLDRIEQGKFPVDEWLYAEVDGKVERSGKITLGLDDVEQYIIDCHKLYVELNLEKLFDADCREDMRHSMVMVDRQKMTVAEARAYARKKVSDKMLEIYHFKMEE